MKVGHPAEALEVGSETRGTWGAVEWKCSEVGHARRGAADRIGPEEET